jgi:hypothetical protein
MQYEQALIEAGSLATTSEPKRWQKNTASGLHYVLPGVHLR